MFYVHMTINVGQREYDLTMPMVKSLDATVALFRENYPDATSMVISIAFNDAEGVASPKA